jgi:intein/homing endonuclease
MFFVNLGLGSNSYTHRIPKLILQSPRSVIVAFLSSLYDGDGYITERVSTYGTASEELAHDLIQVLLTLGIYSRLNIQKESGVNSIPMYLVRTSSVKETQKLISLLDSFKGNKQTYIPTKGPIVSEKLNVSIRAVVHNYVNFYVDCLLNTLRQQEQVKAVRDLTSEFCGSVDDALSGISQDYITKIDNPNPLHKKIKACSNYQFLLYYKEMYVRKVIRSILSPGVLSINKFVFGIKTKSKLRKCLEQSKFSLEGHEVLEKFLNFLADPNNIFESIEDHTYIGKQKVYDISVDRAEHFYANGMVVHNCKHLSSLAYKVIASNY